MKERIDSIPINDAMANAGECPLCFIEKKVEDNALDYVLGSGSSYMEYDTREMTDKAGFCRAHFKKMYDYGNTLGNAWILSTHYDTVIKEMTEQFKNFKPGKGKSGFSVGNLIPGGVKSKMKLGGSGNSFVSKSNGTGTGGVSAAGSDAAGPSANSIVNWINMRNESCFICDNVKQSFADYIRVFFGMYKKDPEFRDKIRQSQGFCLSHFGVLCEAADENLNEAQLAEFYNELCPLMLDNMKRLKEDVAWLIEKYDYRNKDADWKNSKDANQRAMQKLKGGYHHLPPHTGKK